jgi:hypothetical protein
VARDSSRWAEIYLGLAAPKHKIIITLFRSRDGNGAVWCILQQLLDRAARPFKAALRKPTEMPAPRRIIDGDL